MTKGLVYILTNPCLDGWVKIGMTERNDIARRLAELNAPPNIPLSYRCYATYEVENPREVEQRIHHLIDMIDESLHAREQLDSGRTREREFFKLSPERAYGIVREIALLRGDVCALRSYAPTAEESMEQAIAENRTRRANNSFGSLGIGIGERIYFLFDDAVSAEVADAKNRIRFDGAEYSVSGLANKLLVERCGWAENACVNGWRYFTKDGKPLSELRESAENQPGA